DAPRQAFSPLARLRPVVGRRGHCAGAPARFRHAALRLVHRPARHLPDRGRARAARAGGAERARQHRPRGARRPLRHRGAGRGRLPAVRRGEIHGLRLQLGRPHHLRGATGRDDAVAVQGDRIVQRRQPAPVRRAFRPLERGPVRVPLRDPVAGGRAWGAALDDLAGKATMNALDQLKQFTTVVADTGDFRQLEAYAPRDATTNPTLILKAVGMPAYRHLLDEVVAQERGRPVSEVTDALLVRFGQEILSIIPGRVSTEVDARLSFDTEGTIARAHALVDRYRRAGIDPARVLIKIASTWEGIRAAERLEREGIHCNLTLLFSFPQAVACADAGVTLISPFVGRIYDWYRQREGRDYTGEDDPGVVSVRRIYDYFTKFGYETEVMGASFRNIEQIRALAGCDLLTISPELLAELAADERPLARRLDPVASRQKAIERERF